MVRLLIILCLAFSACTQQNTAPVLNTTIDNKIESQSELDVKAYLKAHPNLERSLTPDQWEKLRWLSKTMIVLRGGKGLKPNEDIQYYLPLDREVIVDQFLEKPEFIETLIKFNNAYLGYGIDKVFESSIQFNADIFTNSQALISALQVKDDGDYFSLFEPFTDHIFEDIGAAFYYDSESGMVYSGEEALPYIYQTVENYQTNLEDLFAQSGDMVEMKDFCSRVNTYLGLNGTGLKLDFNFLNQVERHFVQLCPFTGQYRPTKRPKKFLMDEVAKQMKGIDFIIEKTKKYQNYKINGDFDKLEVVDLSQVMEGYQKSFFSGIAFSLTNSSTNFNRTRAAYILDRFLCDNLVPIDVELPDQHSGDAHGSEPSCYACHYRLDPMAGFFKDYGFNFQSFKGKKEITFDDFARMDKEEFDSNWLSNDPAVRKWNIGVVRSEKDETKNYYGEDIVDLFRILKEMPEVKKCMTRRVFEYTTSTGQNVDQEYLDNVYKEFDQISQRNSSHGIKYLFKTFVLNKTFTTQDPEIKKCYDFPTGFDPAGAPPCEVRFILQNKCSNCHFPFGGEGGLDVTTWKKLEGDRFGFVHENGGKQLSVDESFEKMSEALSSSDPKVRMPYKQHMDPSDRETLYLWVNQQLQGAQ